MGGGEHEEKRPSILVTGALGFVFSWVTEHFLDKGWTVYGIDDLSEGSHRELMDPLAKKGLTLYIDDAGSDGSREFILEMQPDYIVHAAAVTDVDTSIAEPFRTYIRNVMATQNVFEAARRLPNLKKLLYISTDEIYGECEYPKKEWDVLFPRNPYSCSKAAGTHIRVAYENTYRELYGKTCEARPANFFGPRQDKRKIMPQIVASLKGEHVIPLQNDGEGYREYQYVKNAGPLVELLLEKGDRAYNVTLEEGMTVNRLVAKCEELTGKKVKTKKGDRPGHDAKYQMNGDRLKKLGWKPEWTFEKGLQDYFKTEGLI